jgi:hypothetical protein
MPHVLPDDWQDVVTRVSSWLDDATVQLDRHENEFLLRFPTNETPPPDTSSLAERLRELPRQLTPLEAVALEAEAASRESEAGLRDLARGSETLRLRLAEWVGRAIE